MKKILIVFNHPAPYKVAFFNELAKYYDLTVIFERNKEKSRNKKFYYETKYNFKTVHIKGFPFGNMNFVSGGVKNHLKNNKYDLVIMNGWRQNAERRGIKYLNKHHIPFVLYINGGIIKARELSLITKIKTKYISSAAYYFSPDKESNKYLVYYGANCEHIFNYPYATISESEILANPISSEEKVIMRKNKNIVGSKVFVSCGQLIKRKNYFELIKRWSNLPSDFILLIIGDGKEKRRYLSYIKKHNLTNIKLLGFMSRKEIFEYYRLSDAFIFPSKEDIYGHVINEAMSQGLPIISTPNVNAAKHLIRDGQTGYIIPSINSNEFTESLSKILDTDTFFNCTNEAKENTLEKMVNKHIEELEEIIK